jgi:hypothetical protein
MVAEVWSHKIGGDSTWIRKSAQVRQTNVARCLGLSKDDTRKHTDSQVNRDQTDQHGQMSGLLQKWHMVALRFGWICCNLPVDEGSTKFV